MERLADHNPTRDEYLQLLGYQPDENPEIAQAMLRSQDSEFAAIASLYAIRGDEKTRHFYLGKIHDTDFQTDLLTHCRPRS